MLLLQEPKILYKLLYVLHFVLVFHCICLSVSASDLVTEDGLNAPFIEYIDGTRYVNHHYTVNALFVVKEFIL